MGICFIGKRSMADFLADYLLLHRGHFVDVDTWAEIAPHDAWETLTIGQKANISGVAHKMYVCAKHTEQVQRQGEPPITVMPLPTPRVKEPASGVVRRDASGRRMRPLKPLPPTPRPPTSHTVFVCASKMHPALWCDELFMQEVQWIDETEPAELLSVDAAAAVDGTEKEEPRSMRVSVKIRSGHEQRTAMLVKLPRSNDASAAATAASPSSSWRVVFSSPQLAVAAGQSCVLYDVSGKRCLGQGRIERAGPSYFQQRKQLPVDALQQHSTDTTSTRN
jgi:tRNA U34 2-thiouridine synthase MnmA/TrmU